MTKTEKEKQLKKIQYKWKSEIATKENIRNFVSYLTEPKKVAKEIDGYTFVKFLKINPKAICYQSGIENILELLNSDIEEEILETLHLINQQPNSNEYPIAIDIDDYSLIHGWKKLFIILFSKISCLPFHKHYLDKITVAAYRYKKNNGDD